MLSAKLLKAIESKAADDVSVDDLIAHT